MKRETKILIVLYLLLFVALIVPFIPSPIGRYYPYPANRWITIIEYIRTVIWAMILRGITT